MRTWVLLGAYLLGFVLLQVYLYRQFIGRSGSGTTTAGTSRRGGVDAEREQDSPGMLGHDDGESPPDSAPAELDTEDAVRCDECGAYNESHQMFAYCRHCGEKL